MVSRQQPAPAAYPHHRIGVVASAHPSRPLMAATTAHGDLAETAGTFLRRYYHEDILTLAQHYPKEQRSLHVEWRDLYQYDPDLADDALAHPSTVIPALEDALAVYDLPVDVDLGEATVRLAGLHDGDIFDVGAYRSRHIGTYLGVDGQVAKVSGVKPRPETAAFQCQRCGTLTTIPQQGTDLQPPHECEGCERQGPFEIHPGQSEFVDHQVARVQQPPQQATGGTGDYIDVYVEGDIVDSFAPGDRVTVAGQLTLDMDDTVDWHVEGRAVEVAQQDYTDIQTGEHRDRIEELARGDHGDPYELLTASIAPTHEGHRDIKLALALQLFGGVRVEYPDGSVDRGDPHILLLGAPGTGKSSLLRSVDAIAPRSVYASGKGASAAGMTAAAVPDEFGDTKWSLEAGALVQADRGIACVDEIDKISDEAISSLHDALESQEVVINKASFSNVRLPARTALLAAGNPKYGRFDRQEPIPDQIEFGPTLLSRFDLIFFVEDQPDEGRDGEVAESMLSHRSAAVQHAAPDREADAETLAGIEPAIDRGVLRAYVAYAKQHCQPAVEDAEVAGAITDWFVALRQANGGDVSNPIPVTYRQLEAVERLAEASARVRLSETVEMEDARRAVGLMESYLRDAAMDPESGSLDVDVIESGSTMSQRERMRVVRECIIEEEGASPASEQAVLEAAVEAGVEIELAEAAIEALKEKGNVYEPKEGYLRVV